MSNQQNSKLSEVQKMENYFKQLNDINVNEKTEQKNGLTYLSWAWAWGEVKKMFPDATYTIYESANGCFYHTDGKTCWVKTGVTVNSIEHIEYLPVMDFKNKSISAESVTSFDVNKAIQRSLTKAVARHGLGLYIYAGEDLPEVETHITCECCGNEIVAVKKRDGSPWLVNEIAEYSKRRYNKAMCAKCLQDALNAEKAKEAAK